MDQELQTAC